MPTARHAAEQAVPPGLREGVQAQPDVYAVQGYDTGQLLAPGIAAVKGDIEASKELITAMETPRSTARAAS